MLVKNKLSEYRSGNTHNLDMFKLESHGHRQKAWKSKDGKKSLITEMNTMHLWHTFRMLLGIIDTETVYLEGYLDNNEFNELLSCEFDAAMTEADIARNAIQYIGHELYKREMQVPSLPEKDIFKKINRADNLHHGFVDNAGELINYNDNE